MRSATQCAGLLLTAASCTAVGPDYVEPELGLPSTWTDEAATGNEGAPPELGDWWRTLDDPVLDSLVGRAVDGNLDLQVAYQRMLEASAGLRISEGLRLPDIDGSGGYSRERLSANGFPPAQSPQSLDFLSLGANALWELDVWGRVRRQIESSDALLGASLEQLRDVRVILAAEVARSYVDFRTFEARLAVAKENVELQGQSLSLAEQRFEAGVSPALDVAQAESNLATTQAQIPTLELGRHSSLSRLAVLLGISPQELYAETLSAADVPTPPATVASGLPNELVRNRPDVRAAERFLAAGVAQIGIAKADLYPRFNLLGSIGLQSTDTSTLFEGDSAALSLGPAFSWNLFDGGRVRGNIAAQEARAEQALLQYRSTVLLALEEVEVSLVALDRERSRLEALERAVEATRRAVALARDIYIQGLSQFQSVLDAERSLFQLQDALLASHGQLAQNYIALQRALGGGSQEEEPLP